MTTRARRSAARASIAACLLLPACAYTPDPHPADLRAVLRGRVQDIAVVPATQAFLPQSLAPSWQASLRQAIPPCRGPYAPECTFTLTVTLRSASLDRREPTTNAAVDAEYALADLRTGAVLARRAVATHDSRSSTDQVYGEDPGRNALAGATERNIAAFLAIPPGG